MEKSFIKEIREAIKGLEQNDLFAAYDPEDRLISSCAQYLKNKGYTVVAPKAFSMAIKDLKGLVEYFYNLLNSSNPENYAHSFNLKKDLGIAKRFVESRMSVTGASKEYVLNECGEIIKTVIENQSSFNFKYNINFSLFGQSNMKWVTDKALNIMNKTLKVKDEEYTEQLRQQSIDSQDMTDLGFDLDSILTRMEEEEDGKKEN